MTTTHSKDWTWAELKQAYPDQPGDDESLQKLKHAYRWGVGYGAIDPDSDKGKKLWAQLNGDEPWDHGV